MGKLNTIKIAHINLNKNMFLFVLTQFLRKCCEKIYYCNKKQNKKLTVFSSISILPYCWEEPAPPAKEDITPENIYKFICFTGYFSRKFSWDGWISCCVCRIHRQMVILHRRVQKHLVSLSEKKRSKKNPQHSLQLRRAKDF